MSFGETKVYYDGSHYIAIPHTKCPKRYRPKPVEEEITVVENKEQGSETDKATEPLISCDDDGNNDTAHPTGVQTEHKTTKKELFEELYKKYILLKKSERKNRLTEEMRPYFDTEEQTRVYVESGFKRKQRNLICRRVRMVRKANLAKFNYFCTVTYFYGYSNVKKKVVYH